MHKCNQLPHPLYRKRTEPWHHCVVSNRTVNFVNRYTPNKYIYIYKGCNNTHITYRTVQGYFPNGTDHPYPLVVGTLEWTGCYYVVVWNALDKGKYILYIYIKMTCCVTGTSQVKMMRKLARSLCQVHSKRLYKYKGIGMISSIWKIPLNRSVRDTYIVTPLIYTHTHTHT